MYLGVDLGGTDIKAVLVETDGRLSWRGQIRTGAADGREAVLARLEQIVLDARRQTGAEMVAGAGFAIPGVLELEGGRVELLTNFTPEWNGFELGAELARRTGLPTHLVNDVRAATVAEQRWGAGQAFDHFICIAVGTGIGGGLVLNGELYQGSRGAAGEIGHQTLLADGPRCNCGNRGCLEALAGGYAIARDARSAIERGDRELAALAGSEWPAPDQVARAGRSGSAGARLIFERAGEAIGRALGNLVCVLNPQAVVIGGGVAAAGDLLLAPVRREIERRTVVFSAERGGVAVLPSPLGGDAGALGAAAWAMRRPA